MRKKSSDDTPASIRSGYASAWAIGVRMSGCPSWAITEPSAYSTIECTTLCGWTTTWICSGLAPKSHRASMTSNPLFIMVAESTEILRPMTQFGCAHASSGVTRCSSARERALKGPPDPSHRIGRTLQGAFACGAAPRDAGRGVRASELGHGTQDLGGFGDHDEQGIGGHRSAVALRCKPRTDPGRRTSAERGAFDGRVRRRFRDRPARASGHAYTDRPGARIS